ncbi:PREDICTED: uncharacterized protein LOC109585322 [Amphimedon queenslandica]|uniref:NACHT domain-containing protein n=1 Tax=Amphimedon queenslandica TaxID=400682 RepID=A0AAN0JIU9_AMPQE|nr:PREDICTED: uncharacterized protein LOC109585322 [Amphimedon queenslandica]|eukprot:XP_019856894.1 PREDICTED: uncharacterized protein LOC109585322 [Amphimedon queenslandica]
MIDLSQWRASIGLWSCCLAAGRSTSSGPATSSSFKPHSTSSLGKRCDLATALALSHVFLMIILLMNHFIHLIGIISYYCYSQLHYTTGTAVKQVLYSLMLLHFAVYSTNMTSSSFYLIIFLLLLLSGDIELNPGPGNPREVLQIHSYDLTRTVASNCYELTSALYAKDLIPHGTKEEIITTTALSNDQRAARLVLAIEGRLESSLDQQQYLINICGVLRNQRDRQLKDIAKSILHQLGQSTVTPMGTSHASLSSSMEHTSTIAKCWQWFCKMMCRNNNNEQPRQEQGIIELQQTNLTVSQPTLGQSVQSLVHDYTDTPSFVDSDIEESVQSLVHDDTDTPSIADSLHHDSHLVEPVPNDVLEYAEIMRQKYNAELIVATDWPPRVGKDFFGRLALVEKDRFVSQVETAWYLLRGQIDRIPRLHGNREITVKNILAPSKNKDSLRVVIDGPPGIGKTTLCRKLLNMWSNGSLVHQHYDLVLYCPLRNAKIAEAKTIADLFIYRSSAHAMSSIAEWFENNHGKGLLIFFDGWDELSEQFRQSSLATSIIHREMLFHCSVIVTSRSYASSSLLEMSSLSKHIQVCGFSEKQIANVIRETLEDSVDSHLAMKLINDLEIRGDVKSLCYVPLVCSMVILVYRKEGGHLPTTLTQLYENFILQTIRRHVKRHDINPRTLGSLSSLPPELAKHFLELCRIAYTNLASTQMTFSSHQLQSLSEEDYLGLMTTFMEYDEEKYQFLHLSIQEFLAAWWIAKHEEKKCYFYCHIEAHYNTYLILLQLFKFSQLKILHFHLISNSPEFAVANKPIDASMELENCIEKNTTVQEMRIKTNHDAFLDTVTAVIKGVTKNKTITSFRVHLYSTNIPEGIFEQLLIKNTTIKALSLNVGSSSLLHTQDSDTPSLKIKEINMPLKALEIRGFTTSQPLLPQGDGLHCLIHVQPYSHPLQLIFSSHPNLCVLEVSLDTEESVCELLTILQNNTTLKALKVNITILTTNVYINVQNMLRLNQTLSYFEIFGQNEHSYYTLYYFPPSYIKYNTSLQSVHISISTTEEVKSAFDAISHMKYLTEINFELDSQVNGTHFILAVMGMLQSSTTIRQLRIKCTKDNDFLLSIDHWRETTQHFYETVFTHPSIEYIQIVAKDEKEILNDFLEEHKRLLLSKHEQEQPYRQLPIVIHSYS